MLNCNLEGNRPDNREQYPNHAIRQAFVVVAALDNVPREDFLQFIHAFSPEHSWSVDRIGIFRPKPEIHIKIVREPRLVACEFPNAVLVAL